MYMKPFMASDQLMFLDFIDLRQASDSWVPAQIKKKPRRRPGPSQQGDLGRFLIYPIRKRSAGAFAGMMSRKVAGQLSIHNPPGNGLRPSTTWSGAVSFCALPPFSNLRVATLPMSFFDEIAAGPGRCPLW